MRLREAAAQQNRVEAGKAIHQMAGAAGSCGLTSLERQFRTLESGLDEMEWTEAQSRIEAISQALSEAESECRAVFPEPGPPLSD